MLALQVTSPGIAQRWSGSMAKSQGPFRDSQASLWRRGRGYPCFRARARKFLEIGRLGMSPPARLQGGCRSSPPPAWRAIYHGFETGIEFPLLLNGGARMRCTPAVLACLLLVPALASGQRASLVLDINQTPEYDPRGPYGSFSGLREAGGKLFFMGGDRPWVSDGTAAGTEILPG